MDIEFNTTLRAIEDTILEQNIDRNGKKTKNTMRAVNRRLKYVSAKILVNVINRVKHETLESFFNALEMFAQEVKDSNKFPIGITSLKQHIETLPLWKNTMKANPALESEYCIRLYNISITRCLVLSICKRELIINLKRIISFDDNIAKLQKEFLKRHIDRVKFDMTDEYIDNLKSYSFR